MPNEEGAAAQAAESTEPNSFVSTLFKKLELPEMYGQSLASIFMFRELLPALVQAGVLKTEQIEEIITSASTKLSESLDGLLTSHANRADDVATTKQSGQFVLDGFRARVTTVSTDH